MWVIHELGTCTGGAKGRGTGTPQANTSETGTSTSGTQGDCTKKATFKAHIAQVLASANTFSDDTTDLVNMIIAEYKWLLSQWFSLMWLLYWPSFYGYIVPTLITIFMSIYYYPPPLLICLGYGIYTLYCHLPLPLFLMLLHWTCPYWPDPASQSGHQCSSSFQAVPHGLHCYVDATYMIPRFHVVFTGVQPHPHFYWLCTYLKYEKMPFSLHTSTSLTLGSYKPRAPCYATDGIQTYKLYDPPNIYSKLSTLYSSLGGRPHPFTIFTSPRICLKSIKQTPLFHLLAFYTSLMFATCTGKILTFCHRCIYLKHLFTWFSTCPVHQTEHGARQLVDFDFNAFDVLFDNLE